MDIYFICAFLINWIANSDASTTLLPSTKTSYPTTLYSSMSQPNGSTVSVTLATVTPSVQTNVTTTPIPTTPLRITSSFPSATMLPTTNTSTAEKKYFCAHYPGGVCGRVLNETLTQFNESERIFDARYNITRMEKFASDLFKLLNKKKSAGRCKWLVQVAVCQAAFPACLAGGKASSLCQEDCDALWRECKDDLNRVTGFGEAAAQLKGIDFLYLQSPTNCSVFPSEKTGNKSCHHIDLFDHSVPAASPNQTSMLFWVVGASFVFIILLLLGLLIWKCRRDAKERKTSTVSFGLTEFSSNNTTMKDRVTWPAIDKLTTKIAELYDPDKLKQFSLDNIDYVCDLGEGQFGLVFKGVAKGLVDPNDPTIVTPVAVKTLKSDSNEDSKGEFQKEVALMSVLDHPNIVRLMAVATEEDPYCMIFEFMEYGDLNKFLREIKPLDDSDEKTDIQLCLEDFLSICCQVSSGMEYLASLHFVHRDLATRNCLVGRGLVVKIADFGMSRDIYSSDYYKVHGDAMLPVRWMPPEALLHGKFTVESDVHSYGVLMWEVFTYALQPFYGYSNEEVMGFAKQGILLGKPDDCPSHIYQVMRDCWQRNSEKRPKFNEIRERLVPVPAPSNYSVPNPDYKSDTVEIKKPGHTPVIRSSYQTPGTLINSGYQQDDIEDDSPPKNTSTLDNSECDV